jgi:hypothetical protein
MQKGPCYLGWNNLLKGHSAVAQGTLNDGTDCSGAIAF